MYGCMYNTYEIEVLVDSNPKEALLIAQEEINHRATPETYHLLALAQLKNGKEKEALKTILTYVEGKTSEPMALFHSALVFKANGLDDKVIPLKVELLKASFELGPVLAAQIKNL